MKTPTNKIQEPQTPITPKVTSEPSTRGTAQLKDNRASTINQRKQQEGMKASIGNDANLIQRKVNKTGLPDNLKSGIENLSGYSMDDVKVHYNSSKPAQLQAHAYAQGTDIHIAPGQQKHLPHEAWHVVQQKQGRVKPTKQLKSKVNINDDAGLEKEADVMGAKALQQDPVTEVRTPTVVSGSSTSRLIPLQQLKLHSQTSIQRKKVTTLTPGGFYMIGEFHPNFEWAQDRNYEKQELQKILGEEYRYYKEDELKIKDNDYADSAEARLRYVITGFLGDAPKRLEEINQINRQVLENTEPSVEAEARALNYVYNRRKIRGKKKDKTIIKEIQDDAIFAELLDDEVWEGLNGASLGNKKPVKEGEGWKKGFGLQQSIRKHYHEKNREPEKSNRKKIATVKTNLPGFYDAFKGRLVEYLYSYVASLDDDNSSINVNMFSSFNDIKTVITHWETFSTVFKQNDDAFGKSEITAMENVLAATKVCIEGILPILTLIKTQSNIGTGKEESFKRSMAMHRAANLLGNESIVWKVGQSHVNDIEKEEKAGKILTDGYNYMDSATHLNNNIDLKAARKHGNRTNRKEFLDSKEYIELGKTFLNDY